jgi:hypothetical protein
MAAGSDLSGVYESDVYFTLRAKQRGGLAGRLTDTSASMGPQGAIVALHTSKSRSEN